MEPIDIRQIERNVYRDYFQDGLPDVLIGAFFLFLGLALPGSSMVPFAIFTILFFAPALEALKKRFVYPRTGYVELRKGDPQPLPQFILGSLALGLVAMVAVLVATGVIAQPSRWYRWMPIMFGIWLTGIFLGLALRVRLARYFVVAAVALISGPVFAFLPLEGKLEPLGLFLALVGAVLLAWGVGAFLCFLRRYSVQVEEADDGRA